METILLKLQKLIEDIDMLNPCISKIEDAETAAEMAGDITADLQKIFCNLETEKLEVEENCKGIQW